MRLALGPCKMFLLLALCCLIKGTTHEKFLHKSGADNLALKCLCYFCFACIIKWTIAYFVIFFLVVQKWNSMVPSFGVASNLCMVASSWDQQWKSTTLPINPEHPSTNGSAGTWKKLLRRWDYRNVSNCSRIIKILSELLSLYVIIMPLFAGKRNQDRLGRYAKRKENMRGLKREANDATAHARQAQDQAKTAQKQLKVSEAR